MTKRAILTLNMKNLLAEKAKILVPKEKILINENTQEQRRKRSEKIKTILEWLYKTFPKAFDKKQSKALKMKIHEDIMHFISEGQDFTKNMLKLAITDYTSSDFYHQTIISSSHRFDLNGDECGTITPKHKAASARRVFSKQKI